MTPVHCRFDHAVIPHSLPLDRDAVFFDYVMIDSKRYYASRAVGTNHSSLVHVIIPGTSVIHAYGKVLEIFQFNQRFRNVDDSLWFSRMHWFVPWRGECEKVWDDL